MINKISKTLWARCGMVAVLLGLAGCTGMYRGRESPEEAVSELTLERSRASADIRGIRPQSVQRVGAERQAADDIAEDRLDVAEQLELNSVDYCDLIAPSDVFLVTVWNHPAL